MKKRLIITMAVIMLLTAFAGCGGSKGEEFLGTWKISYLQDRYGKKEDLVTGRYGLFAYLAEADVRITITNDKKFVYYYHAREEYGTWKILKEEENKIELTYESGWIEVYEYKDGILLHEYFENAVFCYEKQ